jgi:hypothetical protein
LESQSYPPPLQLALEQPSQRHVAGEAYSRIGDGGAEGIAGVRKFGVREWIAPTTSRTTGFFASF